MPKFSGVIPPVVTPLLSHDQLDVDAVDRLTEHLLDGGVSGLFVLGTTGEGPSLSYQIRYEGWWNEPAKRHVNECPYSSA